MKKDGAYHAGEGIYNNTIEEPVSFSILEAISLICTHWF